MFSVRKIFWVFAVAFSSLTVACSSHQDGEEAEQQAFQTQEQKKAEEAAANPVTANRWCRMDDWENYQVVLRMTAGTDAIRLEYLRINNDGPPVTYRYNDPVQWRPKKDENPLPNMFTVELIQNVPLIPTLKGFDEQKRIADEVLPKNTQIAKRDGAFEPKMAMSVKTRDLDTGEVALRNMYPCSSYSETFNQDFPVRPFLEIIMKISQSMDSFAPKDLDHVAKAMTLTEPIEESGADSAALENTQWCSWREAEDGRMLLRTVSFSGGRFIENVHSQNFTEYPDEDSANAYLVDNAKRSEFYEMSFRGGRVYGKNKTDPDQQKMPDEDFFAFLKDGTGTKTMVRLDFRQPDNSRPTFTDLYFECNNPKPLQFTPAFASKLGRILELQMQQLHPPPPPTRPTPAPPAQPSPPAGPQSGGPQPQPQPNPPDHPHS